MTLTTQDVQDYMSEFGIESVVIGTHSRRGYYIALRTFGIADKRLAKSLHGRGDTVDEAVCDLIDQEHGISEPVPETIEELVEDGSLPPEALNLKPKPAPTDALEDLLG